MYQIAKIASWCGAQVELPDPGLWYSLISDFGEPLLHLLVDECFVAQIPDDPLLSSFRSDMVKSSVMTFPLRPGSAWILFVYGARLAGLPEPFSQYGFVLPLEWRRESVTGEGRHSPLLPDELIALADRVKAQMAQFGCPATDCYLHPASEFGGNVDFHIEHSGFGSAWGALAVGLWSLLKGERRLAHWPFSSIAYDFDQHALAPVAELAAKFHIASALGAEEVAVAPQQVSEARHVLREMRRKAEPESPLRELRIFSLPQTDSLPAVLNALMRCNQVSSIRRHLKGWIANAAVIALVGLLAGVWHWDSHRDVIRNFAECETRWGIPVGKGEMRQDQLPVRNYHYAFRYCGRNGFAGGRQLREVRLLGADGLLGDMRFYKLTDHGISRRLFKYNADGSLSECCAYDVQNALVRNEKYCNHSNDCLTVDYAYPIRKRAFTWQALGAFVRATLPQEVRHVKYSFDAQGRIRREDYFTYSGTVLEPQRDNSGVYGRTFSYQETGNAVERTVRYLGKDGEPATSADGAFGCHEFFDNRGLLRERRPVEAGGGDCTNSTGIASEVFDWDGNWNLTGVSRFGVDRELKEDSEGSAQWLFDYQDGEVVTSRFVRADGRLRSKTTNSVAMIVRKIERCGVTNVVSTAVRDGEGRLLPPGVLAVDDKGRALPFFLAKDAHEIRSSALYIAGRKCIVKQAHYDACGRLMETADGIAWSTVEYDSQARQRRVETFGTNGLHTCSPDGFAICTMNYSDDGRITTNRYFNAEGKPCRRASIGSHALVVEQASSHERREAHYDSAGRPVIPKASDAPEVRYILNDYGLPVEIFYFDGARNPVLGRAGWHHAVLRYSAHGDFLGCKFFGVSGDPVVGFPETGCASERFHELRLERDALGNLRVLEYKDAQGASLPQENGVAKWEYSYHVSTGQMSESRSFDASGHPWPAGDRGPVRTEYQSETNGVFVKREYDLNGRYRKLTLAGGSNGRVIREEFHRADGRPDVNEHGVSMVTFEHDARGRETQRLFFDEKKDPVKARVSGDAGLKTAYDENGRVSLRTHLGGDGKPHRNLDGIVFERYKYDSRGRETERIFLNKDNALVDNVEGVAFVETRYDERTNVVLSTTYFRNTRRQLVNASHGYAVRHSRKVYADGLLLSEEWAVFDADEKPVADRTSGHFRVVSLFNASGQVTNQSCYAADETLQLHHEGRYDLARRLVYQKEESHGSVSEMTLLRHEPDGSFVYRHSGPLVARHEQTGASVVACDMVYDTHGDLSCTTFRDRDGNKVTNVLGIAEVKRAYDERRELIEQSYWNAAGEMVAPRGTEVARVTHQYRYGREGVRQTSRYFNRDNFLVGVPEYSGAAVLETHWNADNLLTKLQFWNPMREPVANRDYLTGNVAVSELRIMWDANCRLCEFVGFDDSKEAAFPAERHPAIHVAARYDPQKGEYLLFQVKGAKTSESPFVRIPARELERNLTRKVRWH